MLTCKAEIANSLGCANVSYIDSELQEFSSSLTNESVFQFEGYGLKNHVNCKVNRAYQGVWHTEIQKMSAPYQQDILCQ